MDAQTMLRVAVVLFGLAGAGGLLLAGIRLGKRSNPPASLAMLHGLLAGGGLTLLLYAALAAGLPGTGAWAGLLLLALAALGGLALNLGYHWKSQPLPVPLMLVHAAVAAVGLAVLAVSVWT